MPLKKHKNTSMLDIATGYQKMLIINEIPHLNRLDQSISVQRVVAIYSHFTFIFRLNVLNSEDRKETPPHSVAPHLGLLCSHLFHRRTLAYMG